MRRFMSELAQRLRERRKLPWSRSETIAAILRQVAAENKERSNAG